MTARKATAEGERQGEAGNHRGVFALGDMIKPMEVPMIRYSIPVLMFLALGALSACETVEGAGEDIEAAGEEISEAAEEADDE